MVWNNLRLHLCNVSLSARQGLMVVWQEVFHVTRIWSHHFQPSRTFSALPRYILVKKKKKELLLKGWRSKNLARNLKMTPSPFSSFSAVHHVSFLSSQRCTLCLWKWLARACHTERRHMLRETWKKKIRTQKCKIQSLLKTKTVCFKGACRVIAGAGSTYKFKRTS